MVTLTFLLPNRYTLFMLVWTAAFTTYGLRGHPWHAALIVALLVGWTLFTGRMCADLQLVLQRRLPGAGADLLPFALNMFASLAMSVASLLALAFAYDAARVTWQYFSIAWTFMTAIGAVSFYRDFFHRLAEIEQLLRTDTITVVLHADRGRGGAADPPQEAQHAPEASAVSQ